MPEPIPAVDTTGAASDTGKRAYHAPQLRDFGHLQEVTKTNSTLTVYTGDGGTVLPNIYAS